MEVRFWGVRGSIPSPGKQTVRYGGNTTCISVALAPEATLIFDAGSGIRKLGIELASNDDDIILTLSHAHWDHIQGFPFFAPLLTTGRTIKLVDFSKRDVIGNLLGQIDGQSFPLTLEQVPATLDIVNHGVDSLLSQYGAVLRAVETNHPGGCVGFRLEEGGQSVVFIPDNELFPPGKPTTTQEEFIEFCSGADLLIHDAQYTEKEMPERIGWGHSMAEQVCDLADAAEVKTVVLFHHDPERFDDEIDVIQQEAQSYLTRKNADVKCIAAYDGLLITV